MKEAKGITGETVKLDADVVIESMISASKVLGMKRCLIILDDGQSENAKLMSYGFDRIIGDTIQNLAKEGLI